MKRGRDKEEVKARRASKRAAAAAAAIAAIANDSSSSESSSSSSSEESDLEEDDLPVDERGERYPQEVLDAVLGMSRVADLKALVPRARPVSWFRPGRTVRVYDKMERGARYELEEAPGEGMAAAFRPALTPQEMLEAGVFEGKYLNDCVLEFPREWFEAAVRAKRVSVARPSVSVNRFRTKSRQPLSHWRDKGWLPEHDPRGWFQWYCRYWLGRRTGDDARQIGRWRNFARHAGQVKANCAPGDLECRPRQRQALLQWAWDCYV